MTAFDFKTRRQRADRNHEGTQGVGWQVICTGLAMILLTFFVMLSSFATAEKDQTIPFVEVFNKVIRLMPKDHQAGEGKRGLSTNGHSEIFKQEMNRIRVALSGWALRNGRRGDLEMVLGDENLRLSFDAAHLFEIGSAALAVNGLPLLDIIGQLISQTDYPVRIEGHAGHIPFRTGRYPTDRELSAARANKVLQYLVRSGGLAPRRVSAAGHADANPLRPDAAPENRSDHRRVEILLLKGNTE